MFNCPQWGIGSSFIALLGADNRNSVAMLLQTISVSSLTSCDSLVRVLISAPVSQPVLTLQFVLHPNSDWLHLAEVIHTPPPPTQGIAII